MVLLSNGSIMRLKVSISSMFYSSIFRTKAHFWRQNFCTKAVFWVWNFWHQNFVQKSRAKNVDEIDNSSATFDAWLRDNWLFELRVNINWDFALTKNQILSTQILSTQILSTRNFIETEFEIKLAFSWFKNYCRNTLDF